MQEPDDSSSLMAGAKAAQISDADLERMQRMDHFRAETRVIASRLAERVQREGSAGQEAYENINYARNKAYEKFQHKQLLAREAAKMAPASLDDIPDKRVTTTPPAGDATSVVGEAPAAVASSEARPTEDVGTNDAQTLSEASGSTGASVSAEHDPSALAGGAASEESATPVTDSWIAAHVGEAPSQDLNAPAAENDLPAAENDLPADAADNSLPDASYWRNTQSVAGSLSASQLYGAQAAPASVGAWPT